MCRKRDFRSDVSRITCTFIQPDKFFEGVRIKLIASVKYHDPICLFQNLCFNKKGPFSSQHSITPKMSSYSILMPLHCLEEESMQSCSSAWSLDWLPGRRSQHLSNNSRAGRGRRARVRITEI